MRLVSLVLLLVACGGDPGGDEVAETDDPDVTDSDARDSDAVETDTIDTVVETDAPDTVVDTVVDTGDSEPTDTVVLHTDLLDTDDTVLDSDPPDTVVDTVVPDTDTAVDTDGPPVAVLGCDVGAFTGDLVLLSGEASTGSPTTYAWSVVSAPTGSAAAPSPAAAAVTGFAPDRPGAYVLELRVADGGASSTATLTVHAWDEPAPVAADLQASLFDPTRVYFEGRTNSTCTYGVAFDPYDVTDVVAALGCYDHASTVDPDGALWVADVTQSTVRAFRCDGCPTWAPGATFPTNIAANDVAIASTCAGGDLGAVRFSPDGEHRLVRCRPGGSYNGAWEDDAGVARTADGKEVYGIGYGGLAWVNDPVTPSSGGELVDLVGGGTIRVTGLARFDVKTVRAVPDGFLASVEPPGGGLRLVAVDRCGVATSLGDYPAMPAGTSFGHDQALEPDGDVLATGYDAASGGIAIWRRALDGTVERLVVAGDGGIRYLDDPFAGP